MITLRDVMKYMKIKNVIMNIRNKKLMLYVEVFKMKQGEYHLIVMHQILRFILIILKNDLKQFIYIYC